MHIYTITRRRQEHGPRDLLRVSPPSFRELWDGRWSGLVLYIVLCVGVIALILWSGASHDRILKSKEPVYRQMTIDAQDGK